MALVALAEIALVEVVLSIPPHLDYYRRFVLFSCTFLCCCLEALGTFMVILQISQMRKLSVMLKLPLSPKAGSIVSRAFGGVRPYASTLAAYSYTTAAKKKKPLSTIDRLRRSTNTQESAEHLLKLLNKSDFTSENSRQELAKHLKPVTSITLGSSISFKKLLPKLDDLKFKYSTIVPDEVVNVNYSKDQDLIVLANGTFVGWNFNEESLQALVPRFADVVEEKSEFESDEFDYVELDELPTNPKNNGNSYLISDIILIQNINEEKRILDKVAFSIGLSRSTRLSVLENSLEEFLKITKLNSVKMSKGLKITTTEHDVLQLTGKLFLLRGKLNLYSELIDTPDLYWSEPTLEKIYQSISTNLDINSRISILNRKLDYATEEQRVFLSVLNEKKGTRLEWTIIILILIEVGIEIHRFVE